MDHNKVLLLISFAGICQAICQGPNLFSCEDNTCITMARVCDGGNDCANGEDEGLKAGCVSGFSTCKLKNLTMVSSNGYICRKRTCDPSRGNSCVAPRKRCLCDDECGYTCVNPESSCPLPIPTVQYMDGYDVIRLRGSERIIISEPTPFRYRDMIRYRCRSGRVLIGPLPRCTATKRWTRQLPRCEVDYCARNICFNGGTCVRIGQSVTCSCPITHDGVYCEIELFDPCQNEPCENGGTCHAIGQYNQECVCPPEYSGNSCEKEVFCSAPIPPRRGFLEEDKKEWRYGDVATFQCLEDFELVGNNTVQCLGEGDWSEAEAECRRIICQLDYVLLAEGIVVQEFKGLDLYSHKFKVGEIVTVGCPNRRVPFKDNNEFAPPELRCGYGGSWIPAYSEITCGPAEPVICEIPALDEGLIVDGLFDRLLPEGTVLRARCVEGFFLVGDENVRCFEDGSWSEFPSCERVEASGQAENATCEHPVQDEELLFEGPSDRLLPEGTILRAHCVEGFFLVGDEEVRCFEDGSWSEFPSCERVDASDSPDEVTCDFPILPQDMEMDGLRLKFRIAQGTVVHARCEEGFLQIGNGDIECLSDGTWSDYPLCEKILEEEGCLFDFEMLNRDVEVALQEGELIKDLYTDGESLGFFCRDRNKRTYSSSHGVILTAVTCAENSWFPRLEDIKCVQICRRPIMPEDGMLILDVQAAMYLPNQTLYSECPPLHRHAGNNEIKCMEDGTWSEMTPCQPIGCSINQDRLNKTVVVVGYGNDSLANVEFPVGQSLEIGCASEGHVFESELPATIVCEGKNNWSQDYSLYSCQGTCENRCLEVDGPCACDFACEERSDCCKDFFDLCRK